MGKLSRKTQQLWLKKIPHIKDNFKHFIDYFISSNWVLGVTRLMDYHKNLTTMVATSATRLNNLFILNRALERISSSKQFLTALNECIKTTREIPTMRKLIRLAESRGMRLKTASIAMLNIAGVRGSSWCINHLMYHDKDDLVVEWSIEKALEHKNYPVAKMLLKKQEISPDCATNIYTRDILFFKERNLYKFLKTYQQKAV